MNQTPASAPPRGGSPRDLWALGVVVHSAGGEPRRCLSARARHERSRAAGLADGPVLTIVDELIGGVAEDDHRYRGRARVASFRKLVPVLWSLFLSSLLGIADRGRAGRGLLAGVRRPGRHRHARAVLEPGRRGPCCGRRWA